MVKNNADGKAKDMELFQQIGSDARGLRKPVVTTSPSSASAANVRC
jgi:hypothetical protein